MTPGTYDLALYRGDTYTWRFALWEDSDKTVPVDLTGAQAAAEIREQSAGTIVVALACTITEPNLIDVELNAGQWNTGIPTSGKWDLEIVMDSGAVRTVVAGKVKVTGDITHSSAP